MDIEVAQRVSEVLKAVAHPVRLQIVELLEGGEKCVSEIVNGVGNKQSITSQHLNRMRDKGVLSCRREGSNIFYRIENKNVIKVLHCVHNHCKHGKDK
jgi:DNA-binding transcriptional ArsR family regulator